MMEIKKEANQTSTLPHLSQMKIIKRDGRTVDFDDQKIYDALVKAKRESVNDQPLSPMDHERILDIVERVDAEIAQRFTENVKIYEIQNIVEHTLLEKNEYELAEAYISYRTQRDFARSRATDINFTIGKLINKDRTVVNENANKDSDVFNTQRDLTAGIVGKSIGLKMLPPHVANAHQKGDIHYHDLDYHPYTPMTNCCLIDFKGMLNNGFKIGNAEVESPKSIQTATAQISQIIANVASSQYGGCSADRTDELLAPFAELNYAKHMKDAERWIESPDKREEYAKEKTRKDIFDAMQSLEYEINTLFTSNGQTPFTSLGFGLGTSWFEREIQRAILQIRINGLGSEKRTAIFPKLIFSIKKGVNSDASDPNYDIKQLALECATKRMYPDILNYDKIVELTGSFKVPMGCRSFLQGWQDENGEEINVGRMNLGVVTLNLPRIALEAAGDKEKFWSLLEDRLGIAKDALVYRVERCKEAIPANAPILYMYGAFGKRLSRTDAVNELFKNKRATVSLGYIGLYEVASAFYGGDWENNPAAKEFTLAIVKELKAHTDLWGDEYGDRKSVV